MCGIVGRYGPEYDSFQTEVLAHRGPDSEGIYIDKKQKVGLGHTRLAIQDLSVSGHQPMVSNSGRTVIVFNGEIYNHWNMRRELETHNPFHRWVSQSDTETLVEYIECFGLKRALEVTHGMFAFASLDRDERVLYLVRDRFGEKPLYYGSFDSKFIFASELKAIETMKDFPLSLNHHAICQFFAMNFVPAPSSVYREVSKLRPGSFLTLSLDTGNYSLTDYWNIETAAKAPDIRPFESSNQVFKALVKSVEGQLIADVPIGVFLSGGIDSSAVLIAAMMNKKVELSAYTIGFESSDLNESYSAEKIASSLDVKHEVLTVSHSDVIEELERVVGIYDEPFGDYSQVPTYLLARFASKEVKVVLTGDGGDELFQGYNRHIWFAKFGWIYKLPVRLRLFVSKKIKIHVKVVIAIASLLLRRSRLHVRKHIQNLANVLGAADESAGYVIATQNNIEGLMAKDIEMDPICYQETLDKAKNWALNDIHSYLTDGVLVKVDRATMANSLESRVPMLDHEFAARAWATPSQSSTRGANGKVFLRDIIGSHLGLDISKMPKQGFTLPLSDWLRGNLNKWAAKKLSKDNLAKHKLVNSKRVEELLKSHLDHSEDNTQIIWNLIVFQTWVEKLDERVQL